MRRTIAAGSGPQGRRPEIRLAPSLHSALTCHRAAIQDRLRAPVLRPARNVVADGDRPLLAVGDRAHACRAHASAGEIGLHRHGPAGAKGDVVFARTPLVGMAFDRDRVLRILVEPARLPAEDALRLRRQSRAVDLEMNDVADIDGEIASGARRGRCRAGRPRIPSAASAWCTPPGLRPPKPPPPMRKRGPSHH